MHMNADKHDNRPSNLTLRESASSIADTVHQAKKMGKISLPDFFKFSVEQKEAVVLLESLMPPELLRDSSLWVQLYRKKPEPPPAPPAGEWPITKDQMAHIMGCSAESLPDSLMDDFARCVHNCEMDELEMVYFLGQVGHESCGLRYPVEIHDGSNYEGRKDLGNTQPGDGVKFRAPASFR